MKNWIIVLTTLGFLSASAHKSKAPTADQMKDVIAYLRSIRM
jgi:hypothetical protein